MVGVHLEGVLASYVCIDGVKYFFIILLWLPTSWSPGNANLSSTVRRRRGRHAAVGTLLLFLSSLLICFHDLLLFGQPNVCWAGCSFVRPHELVVVYLFFGKSSAMTVRAGSMTYAYRAFPRLSLLPRALE